LIPVKENVQYITILVNSNIFEEKKNADMRGGTIIKTKPFSNE